MKSSTLLLSLGLAIGPGYGLMLDGLLQPRGAETYTTSTLSRRSVLAIRAIAGRQIDTYCDTPGWIPCTGFLSDRGCRPPGGTCCIDGGTCDTGKDCYSIPGQATSKCCDRGKTCTGGTPQCKTAGFSLCPNQDICCGNDFVCGLTASGASSCLYNYLLGTRPYSTASSTSTSSQTPTSTTQTPTAPSVVVDPQTLNASSPNIGAIAGGVVGGVVLIALIAFLLFMRRKRAKADAVVASAGANTGPNGAGGAGYFPPGAGGHLVPVMEAKFGTPPSVAGLSYSSEPGAQNEPTSGAYGGYTPSHHGPGSIMSSAPGSPPMSPTSLGVLGGLPTHPGTQFSASPAPSAGGRYVGAPEIHDAGGARPPILAPLSPSHRLSTYSENTGANPINTGGGGFYYNSTPMAPAAPPSGTVGGFNPALASATFQNNQNLSPTSPRFSTYSSSPGTPLTANSEQGLLAQQEQRSGLRPA